MLHEDFITQDEIDERLTGGSNYHHGQFRIYEYFMEGHDKKENIAFLKNEYGTGGGAPALIGSDRSDEWHDSKGIKLGKGRIGDPYAKVLLKWNVVEKRIRELVNADKYLTPKGKEAFAQYKKEQAEEAMRREQEKLEHGIRVECKDAIEKAIAEKFDGYILSRDTAEGVIRQYGKERVKIVLDSFFSKFTVNLKGSISHEVEIGTDPLGNLQRLSNALEGMTGKMETVAQKLENVEHQLETAKVEVTKPFAQEAELAEKLERLTELNALLNMDEKGGDGIDMDDEPENDGEQEELDTEEMGRDAEAVADAPFRPQVNRAVSEKVAEHGKERMLADSPRCRISVKEKLAEMRERAYGQKSPEKPDISKGKGKEESL